jgi:hypothetical protein
VFEIQQFLKAATVLSPSETRDWCMTRLVLAHTSVYKFTDDTTSIISKDNTHAPVVQNQTIPALLFADHPAIGSFTIKGFQKRGR